MFALKLLGGLSLESSTTGGAVPSSALQRRRLALLAVLAMGGERGVSREKLQAYLWPESSADRARHALDQLLYATRRDLGRDAVLSGTSDVRLNPAVVRTDLWAFDEAIREGKWADAVDGYAGPLLNGLHLIAGAEFEWWLDADRVRLEQSYHRALEALATSAARAGDRATAAGWWRRRAAADPLSAPVALELMWALDAAGDRCGAIQHARVYQRLVRDTLEIEPDRSVEAFANALTMSPRGDVSEAASPSSGSNAAAPSAPLPVATGDDATRRAPPRPAAAVARAPGASRHPTQIAAKLAAAALLVVALGSATAALRIRNQPGDQRPTAASTMTAGGAPNASRSGERAAGAGPGTADPQARTLYLRAHTAWERRSKDGLEQAVVLYRLAAERDPTYAAAYAGLAQSYAMLGYFGFGPGDAMFPKARAAARRALALDPSSGEAYAALGQALAWEHEWEASEQPYRRALQLAPEDATVHQWYALLLAYVGRAREAAVHTGHASRLDPLSVQINNMHGMMLYHSGDVAGALQQYERTVDAEPDSAWVRQNPWVLSNFAHVAAAAGRHQQALRLLERSLQVVPTHPRPLLDLAYAYVQAGEPERARDAFARADTTHPHYRVYRGLLHATLGELDEAFAALEGVDEFPLPSLVGLSNSPQYVALRADPRFEKIRQRLRLPSR